VPRKLASCSAGRSPYLAYENALPVHALESVNATKDLRKMPTCSGLFHIWPEVPSVTNLLLRAKSGEPVGHERCYANV